MKHESKEQIDVQQRHSERLALMTYLDVVDTKTGQLLGHLGDISADGMMFLSQNSFAIGEAYAINIIWKDEEKTDTSVYLTAMIEVRWHKPNLDSTWHCNGCAFVDFDEKLVPLIEKIEKQLSFDQNLEIHRTR